MSFAGVPLIGFDNFFRRAGVTVTDPSEKTGFPASRLYDGLPYLAWRPDGLSANEDLEVDLGAGNEDGGDMYLCISGRHNLGTKSLTFLVSHSPNGSVWTDSFTPWTLVDDSPVIAAWTAPIRRYHRIRVGGISDDSPQIPEIYLGRRVAIPDNLEWSGFDFSDEEREESLSRAEGSGRLVRAWTTAHGRRTQALFTWISRAVATLDDPAIGFRYWAREIADAGKPFVWHWRGSTEPEYRNDGYLGQTRGTISPTLETIGDELPRRVSFEVVGAAL